MPRVTRRWAVAAVAAAAATGMWGAAPSASAATYADGCSFSQTSVTLDVAGATATLSYTVSPNPSWYYYAEFVNSTLKDETPKNDGGGSISLDYDAVITASGPAPVTVEYTIYELTGTGESLESATVLCSATVTFAADTSDPGDGGGTDPTDPGSGGGTDPTDPGSGGGGGTDPTDPGSGGGGGTDPTDPGSGGGGGTDPTDPGSGGGGGTDPGSPSDGGGTPAPSTPSDSGATGSSTGARELPETGISPLLMLGCAGMFMVTGLALRRRTLVGGAVVRACAACAVVSGGLLFTGTSAHAGGPTYVSETACSFTPDYAILGPGDSAEFTQSRTIGSWTHATRMLDGSPVGLGGVGQTTNSDPFTLTYDDATGDAQSTTGLFLTFEYYPVDEQGEKMPDSSPLCSFAIGFDHDDDGAADGGAWGDKDGGETGDSTTTVPAGVSTPATGYRATRATTLPDTGFGGVAWAAAVGAGAAIIGLVARRRSATV